MNCHCGQPAEIITGHSGFSPLWGRGLEQWTCREHAAPTTDRVPARGATPAFRRGQPIVAELSGRRHHETS